MIDIKTRGHYRGKNKMTIGIYYIISLIVLSLVVALVFALNEHDDVRGTILTALRRWGKIVAALIVILLIVKLLGLIG